MDHPPGIHPAVVYKVFSYLFYFFRPRTAFPYPVVPVGIKEIYAGREPVSYIHILIAVTGNRRKDIFYRSTPFLYRVVIIEISKRPVKVHYPWHDRFYPSGILRKIPCKFIQYLFFKELVIYDYTSPVSKMIFKVLQEFFPRIPVPACQKIIVSWFPLKVFQDVDRILEWYSLERSCTFIYRKSC